jgi:hypothetical protein
MDTLIRKENNMSEEPTVYSVQYDELQGNSSTEQSVGLFQKEDVTEYITSREADSIWAAIDRMYDLIAEVKRLREEVDSLKFIHGYGVKV